MNIGQRLKQARLAQGFTMRELGSKVGVSAAAISKYESGKDTPRPSVMYNLMQALDVNLDFLMEDPAINLTQIAFREDRPLKKKTRDVLMAQIRAALERYVMVESLFPVWRQAKFTFNPGPVNTLEEAESAAYFLRDEWRLGTGPIKDLAGTLEDHGAKVFKMGGIPEFDGFSCLMNNETPVVAFSADIPGDRQRFTMAHELAHLTLKMPRAFAEKLAHRFASALLVPASTLQEELGSTRSQLSLAELAMLKQRWGLSIQCLARRAFEAGIITQKTSKSIKQMFKRNNWLVKEPGDQVPQETPSRFSLLLLQAEAEGLMTPSTAAELKGYRPKEPQSVSEADLGEAAEAMVAQCKYNKEANNPKQIND